MNPLRLPCPVLLILFSSMLIGCAQSGEPDPATLVVPPKTPADFLNVAKALARHGDLFDTPYVEKILRTKFTARESYRDYPDGRRVIGGYDYTPGPDFWYPNPPGFLFYETRLAGAWNSRSGTCPPHLKTSPEGTCLAGFSARIEFNAVPIHRPDLCVSLGTIKAELGKPDFDYLTPHGGKVYEYDYVGGNYIAGLSFGGIGIPLKDDDCVFDVVIFERQRDTVKPGQPASWS